MNEAIKILFFGDIVGKPGRRAITKLLPDLKAELKPDLIMANAENLAHGTGVTTKTLAECQKAGIEFFTSGNHIWKKPEVYEMFKDPGLPLIRPANYAAESPGQGQKTLLVGGKTLLVINLNGQVFIEEKFDNPFKKIDEILEQYAKEDLAGIIVDFHAEATSEKVAMGWYLDGRVSAVLGTHTHIPTADEEVLPKGTAYITDIGMVGLKESVIGVDKAIILNNFLNTVTKAHDIPDKGKVVVNAVLLTLNPKTRLATEIKRIHQVVEV